LIRALVLKLAAACAVAAAAGMAVIAAGYALFAVLRDALGPAGAAAVVAAAAAAFALIGALLLFRRSGSRRGREPRGGPAGLTDRLVDLVRDRPVMAAAAAAAAGWIFMRNPALAAIVAAALSDKGGDRRR
jgi:hypothetical protein